MNLIASKSYDIEQITRLLLEMRDNCIGGDAYDDPKRREKYDAINAVIDLISNPSLLVERPMAGDLISRKALQHVFKSECVGECRICKHFTYFKDDGEARTHCSLIDNLPAVDAVPVVHSEWVEEKGRVRHWHCKNCGLVEGMAHYIMHYCPNCGAKMDEGVSDALD